MFAGAFVECYIVFFVYWAVLVLLASLSCMGLCEITIAFNTIYC